MSANQPPPHDPGAPRIALFGGTFDPVHLGHVAIASQARKALGLQQVRFLPCRLSPHKTSLRSTPGHQRLLMLQLALADLPWAVIDDFELHQAPPSFSWRTAEEMHRRFPQARLFWLMGADQWAKLPEWDRPDHLASLVEFIVATREGLPPESRPGWACHTVECHHPASATAIRANPDARSAADWLHPAVRDHIARHHLYP